MPIGIRGSSFAAPTRDGWHRHHLIPRDVLRYPDLARFVAALEPNGLAIGDFRTNGMFLPSDPTLAAAVGLPLHRGPHQTYNDYVIAMLDRIRLTVGGHPAERALGAFVGRLFQNKLRRTLHRCARDAEVSLGSRDPFGALSHLMALDAQTDAMFAAAQKPVEDAIVLRSLSIAAA